MEAQLLQGHTKGSVVHDGWCHNLLSSRGYSGVPNSDSDKQGVAPLGIAAGFSVMPGKQ